MVAKGAGRRVCPLFGIRRVRFSGVHNVLFLGWFLEHGRCSEVGRFSGGSTVHIMCIHLK